MKNKTLVSRANHEADVQIADSQTGLLFEHNPLPMWVYDLETYQFLAVNHAALKHYGYTEDEFNSMTIKDIRPKEDVSRLVENVEHVTEGLDEAGIWRHVKKDGSLIYVEIVSHTLVFKGRDAELVVAMDVTERKLAEEALRESEEIFSQFMQHSPIYIFFKDEMTRSLRLSDNYSKMLGRPIHELLGKTMDELFPSELAKSMVADDLRILRDGKEVEVEEELDGRFYTTIKFPIQSKGRPRYLAGFTIDITERKLAEAELHLRGTALESTANAIVITDADGRIQWINPAFTRLTGYSMAEVLGRNPRLLNSGMHDKAFYKTLWDTILSGQPWKGELINKRKDGNLYFEEQTITPLIDVSGKITHFIAIKQDITEQRRAQDALAGSEAELRAVFAAMQDVVLILDRDGVYQKIAPTNPGLLYKPPEELLGMSLAEIFPPQEANQFLTVVREAMESGQLQQIEYQLQIGDVNHWFSASITPMSEDFVVWVARDITERKLAEEKIQQSEDRYRDLVENSQDLICTHDLEGVILSANPASVRLLGYEMKEMIGKNLRDFMAPEVRGYFKYYISKLLRRGSASGLLLMLNRQGERRVWEYKNSVRSEGVAEPIVRGMARDVTERKQAEDEIRRLKEFNENLINNMSEGIVVQNTDGYFTFVNPAATAITGYLPDEIVGGHWTKFFPADQHEIIKEADNRRLAGKASQYEIDFLHKSGQRIKILVSGSPLFEDERFNGTMAVFTDITARKQAEEKLQQSEHNLAEAERIGNTGSWDYDVASDTASWSENMFRIFDVDAAMPRELVFRHFVENLVHADDRAHILSVFQDALVGKRPYDLEYRIIKRDGSIRDIHALAETYRDEHGKAVRMVGKVEDITERKQAEEKIRQQLKRLTALREIDQVITSTRDVRSSLDALTAHTASLLGVDAVTVLLFNSATNMLEYGAGLGFLTGTIKTTSVKVSESYAGRAVEEERIVDIPNLADEPHNLLLTGFLKNENFISYHGAPLIVKEKVIGVLEVFNRSIVERDTEWLDFFNTLAGQAAIAIDNARLFEDLQNTNIELEARVVERTADLIRANRAKDEFLASMSHELRTPLNAVLGMSESLQEGIYGELTPRQIDILRTIAESGRHLLELINDILDLSKIEAGKLELQAELVSVEAYCQASMRMVKETAFQKGLRVSMSNTGNIEVILADGRRLKQMLVNLLSNAVKFTPSGGQVGLEVSKEGDHAIRFSVQDNGIGIPADQLDKLFKPFVQLDSSLSRQYTGTGLGLALVRSLAEMHGGSVGVESEVGRGSRFHFIIPIQSLNIPILESAKPSAGSKPKETTTHPNDKKRRILLVEDNVTNMLVTSDYLNDKGYQVIGAGNGLEAIEQAFEQKPDLILMDIQMPGISGLEAIKRIRTAPGFDSVPIIAVTALAMPGDRERCLEAGANEYLTKPVSLKALTQMIESLL